MSVRSGPSSLENRHGFDRYAHRDAFDMEGRYLHREYVQEHLHILAHRLLVTKGIPLGLKTPDEGNHLILQNAVEVRNNTMGIDTSGSRYWNGAAKVLPDPRATSVLPLAHAVQDACIVSTGVQDACIVSTSNSDTRTAEKRTRKRTNKPWIQRYKAHKEALQAVGRWKRVETQQRPRVFRKRSSIPEEKAMGHRLSNLMYRKRFFDASCQEFHDFYVAELGYDFRKDWERVNAHDA